MATVTIKGMSCQHCVNSTKEALEKIPGITNVRVDLENAKAEYDGQIDPLRVKEAIAKIGFEVV